MDKSFKRKLFRTLLAAEAAGLSPGITSAFRDDYRQSIASGLKAAIQSASKGNLLIIPREGGYMLSAAQGVVKPNALPVNTALT